MTYRWSALLVVGGTALGTAFLCVAPFAAVAAIAARTLPLGAALGTVAAMWLANQALGFGVFHYPHDAASVSAGLALGAGAALAAVVAARVRVPVLAFVAAFVTFEAVQFACALQAGDVRSFAPSIVAWLLGGNLLGGATLLSFREALRRVPRRRFAGAPRRPITDVSPGRARSAEARFRGSEDDRSRRADRESCRDVASRAARQDYAQP